MVWTDGRTEPLLNISSDSVHVHRLTGNWLALVLVEGVQVSLHSYVSNEQTDVF